MKQAGEYKQSLPSKDGKDLPIISFEDNTDFAKWLKEHHERSQGICD